MLNSIFTTRLERILGQKVAEVHPIQRGGYTPALRLRVTLQNGGSVFVKAAVNSLTADWLSSEQYVYSHLNEDFMPRLLAWDAGGTDGAEYPLLVLEDLSHAFWPPPWTPSRIEQVLELLARLPGCKVPGLKPIEETGVTGGWQQVAQNPAPFLSLQLASGDWLEKALPRLLAVDEAAALHGNTLVHTDVRSDNLCFCGERAMLVDWNWACLGNPKTDLAFWLPSLEVEGGPAPEALLPDGGDFAAMISGYLASNAGLQVIPDAPHVRSIQRRQLHAALPWAVRALDLPGLDGPSLLEG